MANRCQKAVEEVRAEINLLEQEKQTRLAAMDSDDRRNDFTQALATATTNIAVLEDRLRDAIAKAGKLQKDLAASDAQSVSSDLVELATDLSSTVQEIGLVQATVRVQRVTIEPVDLPYTEAIEIARANRLDWMNQRSVLVDQWRLVAFNANRLLANLDISVVGDLGTLGDSASRFRGPTDNVDVRVSFDAPSIVKPSATSTARPSSSTSEPNADTFRSSTASLCPCASACDRSNVFPKISKSKGRRWQSPFVASTKRSKT